MNKRDLKTFKENEILNMYRNLGIKIIETSAVDNFGIDELKDELRSKQVIFVGHSGVGKSSLVNSIMRSFDVKVGSLGEKSRRGRHTTTTSKYYKWDDDSAIIDTPGIRALDIGEFSLNKVQEYFEEIDALKKYCKFSDCLHFDEEYDDCFIKQGVRNNLITKERYESYVKIIEELKNKRK